MRSDCSNIIPASIKEVEILPFSKKDYLLTKNGNYLKISANVYNMLMLIDGEKSIEVIKNEYKERFKIDISSSFIFELLYKRLPIYESAIQAVVRKKPEYLKLSFIIFKESFLKKITPHLTFFFKKGIALPIIFSALVINTILFVFFLNFSTSFIIQESVVYFFILMFLSVTFHELGHAAAAKHLGARHGGIGGGFYLFTPVYYADVTDIWRLPKNKRIVVNIAGVYFEVIFVTITSIIGAVIQSEPLITLSFAILMQSIANFNPFIRSDGYWVLSDIVGSPNLMSHASDKIKTFLKLNIPHIKQYWGFSDYLLLCYGVSSYIFIGLFLYYVLIKNPDSLLYFPIDVYKFVQKLFNKQGAFSIAEYGKLIPAAIFYILFFRVLNSLMKRRKVHV